MTPRIVPRRGTLLAAAALAGCGLSYDMERAGPPGAVCPVTSEQPAVTPPPDTTVLRWYRAAEERDRRLGAAGCSRLAAPTFVGTPSARFPAWRTGDSLVVVSWKAEGDAADARAFLERGLGLRCEGPRSALAAGRPPFVLLLQGALRTAGASAGGEGVDEVARTCGLALHYVASETTDAGGRAKSDRGNAILSTLPLTIPVAVELPIEAARRVAVAATVLTPGNDRVRFVSVEVDGWSTIARTLLSGNQFRTRQVRGLADGLDAADDDGPLNAATLVGGDFGSWDDGETALRIMREAFGESPAWDRRNTRGPFASDHVFFRRGSFPRITVGHYERLDEAFVSGRYGRRVVVNYLPPGAP